MEQDTGPNNLCIHSTEFRNVLMQPRFEWTVVACRVCLVGYQNIGMVKHEHANSFYQNLSKFRIALS